MLVVHFTKIAFHFRWNVDKTYTRLV